MQFSFVFTLLALKKCGSHSRFAGLFLCAVLFAQILLRAGSTLGQEPTDNIAHDFYPWTLDTQLRQIVESPAAEVLPLRETCVTILKDIACIVDHLEHNPTEACSELLRLEESVKILEKFRKSWTATDSLEAPYIPTAIALDEIAVALQRRLNIWWALLNAEIAEASPVTTLFDKSFADVKRLKEHTLVVEQYLTKSKRASEYQTGLTWCEYLETQSWISELEACQQSIAQPIRLVSLSSPCIPVDDLKTLSGRANKTIQRLESQTLTNEQRVFLNHPAVNSWKEELQSWTADLVNPIHILRLLERYESTGGMTDMKMFSGFIDMLSASKTLEYRQLGNHVRRQYEMPNLRLFLSCALLNNSLPPASSETASFRDVIQSQPTVGRRQTETELKVSFIPHPTRVLTAIDVDVDLATFSRTEAFATHLFNTGRTLVRARKVIELTEKGFLTAPCDAQIVGHRTQLKKIETNFDAMPVVGGLFQRVVRNQYASKASDAQTEARQKILRRVRNEVDWEVEKRLQPISEQIRAFSQFAEEEFGLSVEKQDSRTEENWLLSAWGVRGKNTLSSSTQPPDTLPGSYADLKIHESLLNMLLAKLEFEGKRGTVGEFKRELAEKFKQPSLASPEENDDVEVTFAAYNPMVVRFVDGRIEITISIAALRLPGKTHRNFQVIVRYKPACDADGRLVLVRDGYMSLISAREQFILRAAFNKIFPVCRPLPLVPKVLENDPQFDYLTTGYCRIERGWVALALVEKPESVE